MCDKKNGIRLHHDELVRFGGIFPMKQGGREFPNPLLEHEQHDFIGNVMVY